MAERLKRINARHREALSRVFVVQVAVVAALFLKVMDGPPTVSYLLILLSLFVWPLVAAWPARSRRLLRGALTNALAILFLLAYFAYLDGRGVILLPWPRILVLLAFSIVAGMAAGGQVERWRGRRQAQLDDFSPPQQPLVFPRATALPYKPAAGVSASLWREASEASPTRHL